MKVEILDTNTDAWDDFVFANDQGTFFHLSGWKQIIEGYFGYPCHYAMYWNGRELQGILPLVHFKNLFAGNALISTPFLVYGGVVATSANASRCLLGYASELGRELGVDYVELRNNKAVEGSWVT